MEDKERLSRLHEAVFVHGQETVAREVTLRMFEKQAELTGRAAQVAKEVVDLADEIASDGDPDKRQIAELLRGSVLESLKVMQQVATGQLSAEAAKEALQVHPFSGGSSPSSKSLPAAPGTSDGPLALPQQPSPPAKRGRGRPPKPRPPE